MNDDDKRMMAILQNGNNGEHYPSPFVKLTDDELDLAARIGTIRNETMNKMNLASTNRNLPDKAFTEIMAVGAEIAVAKYLNLYFEYRLPLVPGSCDILSRDGRGIDVKFTKYRDGKLIVPDNKRNSCSLYVLVINSNGGSYFDIVGWTDSERLFHESNLAEMYGKMKYIMHQIQLNPIHELL